MNRVNEKIRLRKNRIIMIKKIIGIILVIIICSAAFVSSATKSYFTSSANAQVNFSVAQFEELIKYSFNCASLENEKIISLDDYGARYSLLNNWLISHDGFKYKIDSGCFLNCLENKETEKYPNNCNKTIADEVIINPCSINIYSGDNLKIEKPVIYFDVKGDLKDYIEPISIVYCDNKLNQNDKSQALNNNIRNIGSTKIKVNLNFMRFINDCNSKYSGDRNIKGSITIGYLNSYKSQDIPVEFTKEYLLYKVGREIFDEIYVTKACPISPLKIDLRNNNKVVSTDNLKSSSENIEGIILGYCKLNDKQKQMLDLISPNLTTDIEKLINTYNDLSKKYNELSDKKAELEKELLNINSKNADLSTAIEDNQRQIDELKKEIESLKCETS